MVHQVHDAFLKISSVKTVILVTATAGSDYILPSTPLIFPVNSSNGDFVCGIDIIDDDALESEENFIVFLSTEDPVTLGNTQTNVTISDNDGKIQQISSN